MASTLELLEERFRKVEQASERRVFDDPDAPQLELVDPLVEPRSYPKKPGLSINQFRKQEERGDDGLRSLASSPVFSAAPKSTFYHALADVGYYRFYMTLTDDYQPRSVNSFVSANFEEGTGHTEGQHETQVERIIGRKTLPRTVGALLPRRLARTQSQLDHVSTNKCMVVDVLVETTTESLHPSPSLQSSVAYATRPSRPRAATVGALKPYGGLVERARGFARKLRRKSGAEHL